MAINDTFFLDCLESELADAQNCPAAIPENILNGLKIFGFSEEEILLINYYRNEYSKTLTFVRKPDEQHLTSYYYDEVSYVLNRDLEEKDRKPFEQIFIHAHTFVGASIASEDDLSLRKKQMFAYAVITSMQAFNKVDVDALTGVVKNPGKSEGQNISSLLDDYSDIDYNMLDLKFNLGKSINCLNRLGDMLQFILYDPMVTDTVLKDKLTEEDLNELKNGIPCRLGALSAFFVHLGGNQDSDIKKHIEQIRDIYNHVSGFFTEEQKEEEKDDSSKKAVLTGIKKDKDYTTDYTTNEIQNISTAKTNISATDSDKQNTSKMKIAVVGAIVVLAIALGLLAFSRMNANSTKTDNEETYSDEFNNEENLVDENQVEEPQVENEGTLEDDDVAYIIGETYYTQTVLKVREGPGKDQRQLSRDELSAEDYAISEDYPDALLKKGSPVTCLDMLGDWMRISSGWICVYDEGEELVK